MRSPSLPAIEALRLAALCRYGILDTEPEQVFDDLSELAARICETPVALISLVDAERQWFKSRIGLAISETARDRGFCAHAIREHDETLVVADARADARFADSPLVTGDPFVRFYAGAPLVTPDGHALGTLCVIDHQPRTLAASQIVALRILAKQVVAQLELRKKCIELHALATELERSYREMEEFSYVAAHDLREPLRKLTSFSKLLRDDLGSELPERARKDLGFIEEAALRMDGLIRNLLDLAQASSGRVCRDAVPLRECVDRALEALSVRITETSATIDVGELPVVPGDRTLLTQLFQNLLSNALKFVREKPPHIDVTCVSHGDRAIVGVRDNGIGIDPAFAEQVFLPFRRLHGRSEFEGTGIGLSIARKVVERHGGRIWVESSPGEGSHFRFELIAIQAPGRADAAVVHA